MALLDHTGFGFRVLMKDFVGISLLHSDQYRLCKAPQKQLESWQPPACAIPLSLGPVCPRHRGLSVRHRQRGSAVKRSRSRQGTSQGHSSRNVALYGFPQGRGALLISLGFFEGNSRLTARKPAGTVKGA